MKYIRRYSTPPSSSSVAVSSCLGRLQLEPEILLKHDHPDYERVDHARAAAEDAVEATNIRPRSFVARP